MDRVCREGDGLFPSPDEITLSCSCPDWAGMCKHVAATLYGVGARLDHNPQLLFVLRGVDESDLFARTGEDMPLSRAAPSAASVLDDSDVAALFGLEMADTEGSKTPDRPRQARPASKRARAAERTETKAESAPVSIHGKAHRSRNSSTRTNPSARNRTSRTSNTDRPAT
jgi:uncharacterized Zn finger protein